MTRPGSLDRRVVVLFTSVGNEALHGFVPRLRRLAPLWVLLGTDMRESAAGFALCDDGWTVPARSSDDYLDVISGLVSTHQVDLVYPLSTRDQDYFSRPEVQARLGVPVVVGSAESLAAANTKVGLFEAVSDLGLLPDHRTVRTAAEASAALKQIVSDHGAAVFKRDLGTGGSGMLFVGKPPADAAPVAGRELLDVASASARLAAEPAASWDRPAQVVAWLPGEEYSVDVLADEGTILGGVVRLRRASVGGLATDSETVAAPDVWAAAVAVAAKVSLSYVANIQFRRDADGTPRLMEINPRIPGTIGLTVAAGLDLPIAAAVLALGDRMDLGEPEIGLRVLRHAGAVYTRRRFGAPGSADGGVSVRERVNAAVEAGSFLLWDLDGTLVRLVVSLEDVRAWKRVLQERFEPRGWDEGWSPMLPSIERAVDGVGAREGRVAAEVLRRTTYDDLDGWEASAIQAVEAIPESIEALRDHLHLPTAVVTNNGFQAAVRGLERLEDEGVDTARIGGLVHRCAALRAKPSPAMFQVAIDRLAGVVGRAPTSVVVVGDSPGDAAAARALAVELSIPVRFVGV